MALALILGCASAKRAPVGMETTGQQDLRALEERAAMNPEDVALQLLLLKAWVSVDSVQRAASVADRLQTLVMRPPEADVWCALAHFLANRSGGREELLAQLARPEVPESTVSMIGFALGHPFVTERVTELNGDAAFPNPSPDGRKLAFQWDKRGNWDIFVLDLSSRELTQLTDHPARDESPCFAPNGRALAFTSTRNDTARSKTIGQGDSRDIFLIGLDGGSPICIVGSDADDWYPRFAPDGRSLFFASERDVAGERKTGVEGRGELYRLWFATGQVQRLTVNETNDTAPWASHDGARLYFARAIDGLFHIFVMNLGSSEVKQVFAPKEFGIDEAGAPSLSRKELLAFVGRAGQNFDIYALDLRAGKKIRLTRHPALDQAPVFDQAGDILYFHSNRTGRFQLYRIYLGKPVSRSELIEELQSEAEFGSGNDSWNREGGKAVYALDK